MMEIENENKGSMFVNFVSVLSVVAAIALSYLTFANWQNAYQISKAKFVCTKIEQVGKNLDDVVCVQYTNQKYSKEAVALNSMMNK